MQELSDRVQIEDLLYLEITAIDERDWDMWESIYTADALVDWSEAGAMKGTPAEVRAHPKSLLFTFRRITDQFGDLLGGGFSQGDCGFG